MAITRDATRCASRSQAALVAGGGIAGAFAADAIDDTTRRIAYEHAMVDCMAARGYELEPQVKRTLERQAGWNVKATLVEWGRRTLPESNAARGPFA